MLLSNKQIYFLLTISSLSVMSGALIAPAIPGISLEFADLENSAFLSRIVLTLPALFIAIAAIFAGRVAQTVGRKRMLVSSLWLYAISGLIVYFADSIWFIFLLRAFTGISIAGIMTCTTSLLADYSPETEKSKVLGRQSATMAFSAVIFSFLGGYLANIGWRIPFLVFPAGAIAALVLTGLSFRENIQGRQHDSKFKIPPLQILILAVCFGTMAIFYQLPTRVPFAISEQLFLGAIWIGLAMAILNLSTAATSLLFGFLLKHLSFKQIFALMLALMSGGYALLAAADSIAFIFLSMAVAGAGLGLLYPNVSVWLSQESGGQKSTNIMSAMTGSIFLGQFLSPIIFHPLFETQRFSGGMWFTAGILLLGFVGFLLWSKKP